jgi:hypothetical protein
MLPVTSFWEDPTAGVQPSPSCAGSLLPLSASLSANSFEEVCVGREGDGRGVPSLPGDLDSLGFLALTAIQTERW